MSATMSDMDDKVVTYTLRDLNRRPAKVLSACDAEGEVEIRTRSGNVFAAGEGGAVTQGDRASGL